MIDEDKVRERPKKMFPCKRNKGQHEWGDPEIESSVRYIHLGSRRSVMSSDSPNEARIGFQGETFKFSHSEISVRLESKCTHCGKKELTYLKHKIK